MDRNRAIRVFAAVGIIAIVAALGMVGYSMGTRVASHTGGFLRSTGSTEASATDAGPLSPVAVGQFGEFTSISTAEARITVPDLKRMEVRGAANVSIGELDLSSFAVAIDGAANVSAVDATIDSLDLVVNGAANIDLSKASVTDAQVSLDGASNLEIAMDGGTLSGVLRGLGNVTYTGRVAAESIRVEGIGRVCSR